MSPFSDNSRVRMSHSLAENLEKEIMEGVLKPGDRLPSEAEIGDKYSVSRTVVREALQTLKARRLVVSRKGSGSYVANPGGSSLRDSLKMYSALLKDETMFFELMELRLVLETHCARLCAQNWTPARQRLVQGRLDAMRANQDSMKVFAASDISFHMAIVEASGQNLFREILGALLPQIGIRFAREAYVENVQASMERVLRQHEAIYDALVARDPDAAEVALKAHLISSRNHFRDVVNRGKALMATTGEKA